MTSSIAAIKTAQKQLGLDDDTYRAKLRIITGKSSAKEMTEDERQRVITVFRNEGFRPAEGKAGGRQQLTGKYAKKMQALWIAGWNLGIVQDRDDTAMLAFIKRQTGLDHIRFLHHAEDARKAIEGLKGWLARDGGVVWADQYRGQPDGVKIAWAQWEILGDDRRQFRSAASYLAGCDYEQIDTAGWVKVMNALGKRVRGLKGATR
ncbi:regulatory protein GemA [Ensifer soli]|uniref:regulatory protein GemA n=1 Tax=Ciceribacter sp. sgz301302 TaxID=3342379 RepID=UPI0035B6CE00